MIKNNNNIDKFIDYQEFFRPVYDDFIYFYCKKNNLNENQFLILNLFFSFTYSEIGAVYLYNNFDTIMCNDKTYINKVEKYIIPNVVFNSARIKAKNMKWFKPFIKSILELYGGLDIYGCFMGFINNSDDKYERYKFGKEFIKKINFMGDFSSHKFMENVEYCQIKGLYNFNCSNKVPDWKVGSNMTSGMFNVLGMKNKADEFDELGTLNPDDEKILNNGINILEKEMNKKYGQSINEKSFYMPKLCSFRNLYKNRRYGGYHHDRQLENINFYKELGLNDFVEECFFIRKNIYNNNILGELNGWNGIRKELNKEFNKNGFIGTI